MVACEDGKVFDLVAARATAVGTIVADEGTVAEKEEIGVRIQQCTAGVAAKAINMPSVAGCASQS